MGRPHTALLLSLFGCLAGCSGEAADAAAPAAGAPVAAAQGGGDEQTTTPSDFVRFVAVEDGGHLDTAITTYHKDGVDVIFYGAVHIADKACYEELNDRFTTCDVLLYELVGPDDYRPTKDRETGFNPVAMLQNGMKRGLELAFQLDEIDYLADNFVHADMTAAEFASSMEKRGESLLTIMLDMMLQGMQMQREQQAAADEAAGEAEDGGEAEAGDGAEAEAAPAMDLVTAFRSGEGRHLLRMQFASQLEQMEMLAAGGEGSTLLEGRNEKCLEVLQREIGNDHDRIGIYYGAAHLPHLERRLVEDLGFRKTGHEWLVAWDCKKRPDPKLDRELLQQRRTAKQQLAAIVAFGASWRQANGSGVPADMAALQQFRGGDGERYEGPLVDPWGHAFRIEMRRFAERWQAVSVGPDGVAGSDDDVVVVEPRS